MKKLSFGSLSTESVIKQLAAHPYRWAFAICMFAHFLFLSDITVYITTYSLFAEQIVIQLAGLIILFRLHDKKKLNTIGFVLAEVGYAAAVFMLFFLYSMMRRKVIAVVIVTALLVTALVLYMYKSLKKKELKEQLFSLLILGLGFSVKLGYSLETQLFERQHDLYDVDGGGHIVYIEYLINKHHLPNEVDPRTVWQFYHPPLHHTISAIWVSFNEYVLGLTHDHALNTIKILCLFYAMCIMISCYKILKHFRLNGLSLFIPLTIINFTPQFVFFSGSANNDVLSVALSMGAVSCALEWYGSRTMKNILKIALCIGFAMMTKISSGAVAPAIAILFLAAFIRFFKTEGKKLFGQFVCFGLVCVPLGLWFAIRNYFKWGVPLLYVQEMLFDPTEARCYIGNYSLTQRLFDFSPYQFSYSSYNIMGSNSDSYMDFNPMVTLLKSSVFNEYVNPVMFGEDKIFNIIAYALFWVNVAIALLAFVRMIEGIVRKSDFSPEERILPAVYYLTLLIGFYKVAIDYPFTFSMNFRYVAQIVPIGALYIGLSRERRFGKASDGEAPAGTAAVVCDRCLTVLTIVYAVLCAILMVAVCCPHAHNGLMTHFE